VLVKVLAIYAITLVVAMLVALVVKGIVVALGAVERRSGTAVPRPSSPAVAPAEAVTAIPAEHVAAIAAAVHAIIGEHHIVHIEDPNRGAVWVAEGRHAHHTSHAIEHRPRINSRAPSVRGGKR